MKHAYLIITHNEFEVLQRLVAALDDERNDIFIHFDKKVKVLPEIKTKKSGLFVIQNRVDIRWGHVSQIEAELLLLETSYTNGPYDRYHIISGVHLPLKSNDYIHRFFCEHEGEELLHMWPFDDFEANVKIRTRHFFVRWYKCKHAILRNFSQIFWNLNLKVQRMFDIRNSRDIPFYKSDNWLSLTGKAVGYLVARKTELMKMYRHSFCGDEFFVATELMNNKDKFNVFDSDRLLYVDFIVGAPRNLTADDEETLLASPCLFARKFDSKDTAFLDRILTTRL